MIKKFLAVIFAGLFLFCISCQNHNVMLEGFLDKEFTLEEGQQIRFKQENLLIKFLDVPKDNRCKGVCVWEGNADVAVQVIDNNEKTNLLILNTTNQSGYSMTKDFGEYKIQLMQLDSGGIFSRYRVSLLITKQ